jgi:hypothetical protein
MIYDRALLLREWQLMATEDPQRPAHTTPDDWLRMNGFSQYTTQGIAAKRPEDQWTKTP